MKFLNQTRFIDKLSEHSLLAIRTLLSSILGLIICYIVFISFNDENFKDRIYWVVFAVISISSASNNIEVILSRAKGISFYSILGCLSGSLVLYLSLQYVNNIMFIEILCASGLLLYGYTMFLNYTASVFFIHFYLVMFFGIFVTWNEDLFITRIVCVIIGSISTVFIVFLTRTTKNRQKFIIKFYDTYQEYKKIIINLNKENISDEKIIELMNKSIKLNDMILSAKYEFKNKNRYYSYKKMLFLMEEILISIKTYKVLKKIKKHHSKKTYCQLTNFTNRKITTYFEKLTIKYNKILQESNKI